MNIHPPNCRRCQPGQPCRDYQLMIAEEIDEMERADYQDRLDAMRHNARRPPQPRRPIGREFYNSSNHRWEYDEDPAKDYS